MEALKSAKKAHFVLRGIFFVFLSGLISKTGFYGAIVLSAIGLGILVAHKFGKIPALEPKILRASKYVGVAALIAIFTTYTSERHAIEQAATESNNSKAVTTAKELMSVGKYDEAHATLAAVSSSKGNNSKTVEDLLSLSSLFQSQEARKKFILSLSSENFGTIVNGGGYKFTEDTTLNAKLLSIVITEAKILKPVFASNKKEEERIARQEAADQVKRDRRIASFGEPPARSAWNGGYSVVERYLKQIANDPDSIKLSECTKVQVDDKSGWLVGCDYRGKNGFGASIKKSNWFVIRHGAVVKVLPADTYK